VVAAVLAVRDRRGGRLRQVRRLPVVLV
jgi:hypothetical protein